MKGILNPTEKNPIEGLNIGGSLYAIGCGDIVPIHPGHLSEDVAKQILARYGFLKEVELPDNVLEKKNKGSKRPKKTKK